MYAQVQSQKFPQHVWESQVSQWGQIGFLENCLLRKYCVLGAEPTKMNKTIPAVHDLQDLMEQMDT